MAFEFLPLPYDFNDLRPAMTEKVARWHHYIVHGAYLAEINRLLLQCPDFNGLTIEEVLSQPQRLPASILEEVRFQGGGHANHQFMWKILGVKRGRSRHDRSVKTWLRGSAALLRLCWRSKPRRWLSRAMAGPSYRCSLHAN